jgi:hypothetical protein
MDMETIPECICGGTGCIRFNDQYLSFVPCGECIARYDRTHCSMCHNTMKDGQSIVHEDRHFCSKKCVRTELLRRIKEHRKSLTAIRAALSSLGK